MQNSLRSYPKEEESMNEILSNAKDPALLTAENYEKRVVTYTTSWFAAVLLEHANPQPGERVVDIACGTGIVARKTAPRVGTGGAVVAVDINPAMLTVGRALTAPEGATIEWREGDAQALPLPDNTFNLALCSAGLQFFPDRPAAVREMYRVLQPEGRLGVSVARSLDLNPASNLVWGTIARHLNTTPEMLTPAFSLGNAETFRSLLESAGFADVALFSRSCVVREPRNPQLIAGIFASLPSSVVPALVAMGMEERNNLAQAVESEIGPGLQKYVEGDEQLYPMSVQVALAYKR
jgi:SAM-dependent methyltransferase